LAAGLLGGCYLHIVHSHYATFDVMVGLWAALTLLLSDLLRTQAEGKWYLLAGLAAGFAGATKYNGALVIVIPLIAHVLATPWGQWGWLNGRLLLLGVGFVAGLFGGNPFALGNLPEFLNGLALVLHHYGTEQPGFEGAGNWRWYLRTFLTSSDALWFVTGMAGMVGLVWKDWKKGVLLAAFPMIYFSVVARFTVRFERNMVPLLPFLAVAGAWLLDSGADWLARRLNRGEGWSHGMAVVGLILILAVPLAASIGFNVALSGTDHRELAGEWIEDNVALGSKMAIEHYSIPFDHTEYQVKDVLRISDHDLSWYQQEGYDLLIISDGVWELLRKQPALYAEKVSVYDDLTSRSKLLAEFLPSPPGLVVAGYPTIDIYHFAPVRIYRVPETGENRE
jgi:hypothetical protein